MEDDGMPIREDQPVSEEPETTEAGTGDVVEIRLPANSAYLSVLRTATAGLAARLDFTLDEIDDLRIAVDEACALILPDTVPGGELACRYTLNDATLHVAVSAKTRSGQTPGRSSFAWTVLSALGGDVEVNTDQDDRVTIALRKHRSARP
jgi:serine/threonine-protein kinase RsbW